MTCRIFAWRCVSEMNTSFRAEEDRLLIGRYLAWFGCGSSNAPNAKLGFPRDFDHLSTRPSTGGETAGRGLFGRSSVSSWVATCQRSRKFVNGWRPGNLIMVSWKLYKSGYEHEDLAPKILNGDELKATSIKARKGDCYHSPCNFEQFVSALWKSKGWINLHAYTSTRMSCSVLAISSIREGGFGFTEALLHVTNAAQEVPIRQVPAPCYWLDEQGGWRRKREVDHQNWEAPDWTNTQIWIYTRDEWEWINSCRFPSNFRGGSSRIPSEILM